MNTLPAGRQEVSKLGLAPHYIANISGQQMSNIVPL